MSKKILINDSHNIYIKNIIKYISRLIPDNIELFINRWNNQLFYAYQKINPQIIIWSTSSYNQEFHQFLSEYGNQCKILLLEDAIISQDELIPIINNNQNISVVSNRELWKNRIAELKKLYDHDVFSNFSSERNNKYLALLSADNNKNQEILSKILYPNNLDKKIVAMGNPEFDHPANVGLVSYTDLPYLFNKFSYLIDIESDYLLEGTACGISILQTKGDLQEAINDNILETINNEILLESTYNHYVNKNIISFIKENL